MINLRVILRSISKNLIYTWTNVLGLAIAFCFVFLTAIYLIHEHTFDQSYSDSEKIHRLVRTGSTSSLTANTSSHAYIMADNYLQTYPAIESMARAYNNSFVSKLVRTRGTTEKTLDENGIWYVEREFLSMFDVQARRGAFGMFDVPGTVLISESVNEKLFEGRHSVGEKLLIGDDELEVIGVYKDFPSNSSLDPRFIISVETLKANPSYDGYFTRKGNHMFQVFLSLKNDIELAALETQLTEQSKREQFFSREQLKLESIEDYHFSDLDFARSYRSKADEQLVTWLSVISLCLLAVAIANFGNISLAVALSQSKEIVIHKIIGARKSQLVKRSLIQSLCLSFISFICALILIEILMPFYSQFVDRELSVTGFGLQGYFALLIFTSAIGLIAGIYPSLVVSSFSTSNLFNAFNRGNRSKTFLRKTLLVFQFFIAFGIISAMLFMNRQLEFMMSKEPGYNYKNTLVFQSSWFHESDATTIQTFKDRLMAMSSIQDIALSDKHPMRPRDVNDMMKAGFRDGWEKVELMHIGIDCHFFDFYGIETTFDDDVISLFCSDSEVALINESGLNMLDNDPIGKRLPPFSSRTRQGTIVQEGTVSDFHFNSVSEPIPPMAFVPMGLTGGRTLYSIRYSENANLGELIQNLQDMWWEYEPTETFVLKVLDEEHQRLYSSEIKMMHMTGILGVGVCLIAFAGVFAMSVFYGRERLKEISIRKVLGAGVGQLFRLQNRMFVLVMLISILIGTPVVIMVMDSWISQFAYRTNQPTWIFMVAGVIMFGATILSSGWYSLKVAKINPSDILRDS